MTTDQIMMLTSLDGFAWKAKDYLYAFPCDETNPDQTNGHGVDVRFDYSFSFVVSLKSTPYKIGTYTAEIGLTYFEPYGKQVHRSISLTWELSLGFLRENTWEDVLLRLQESALCRSFFSHLRTQCEGFLLANPPVKK